MKSEGEGCGRAARGGLQRWWGEFGHTSGLGVGFASYSVGDFLTKGEADRGLGRGRA